MAVPTSTPSPGAIYRGTLVGVSAGTGVVKPVVGDVARRAGPLRARPAGVGRGKTLRFWQSDFQAFQTSPATPGGKVDLKAWPRRSRPRVARDLAFVRG